MGMFHENSHGSSTVRRSTRRRGFTLIELLIVISIIAILAAILFPVFARARENARRTSCASNLKQLGLAFAQYTQDYDEQLPINGSTSSAGPGTHSWDVAVAPYSGVEVKPGASPLIFRCPSDTSAQTRRSYVMIYNGMYASDGGASGVLGYDNDLKSMVGVKIASIPQPAETLMLVEMPSSPPGITSSDPTYVNNSFGNYSNSYAQKTTGPAGTSNAQDKSMPGKTAHLEGWNYLFCDGHVKWLRPERTTEGGTAHKGNMWARMKD